MTEALPGQLVPGQLPRPRLPRELAGQSAPAGSAALSSAPVAPWGQSAPNSLGASVVPLALSMPPEPKRVSPWFGRGLSLAAAACLFVIVQRNGLAHSAAAGIGQTEDWQQIEEKIGGGSVATPQGLRAWLDGLRTAHHLDTLSSTDGYLPQPLASSAQTSSAHRADDAEPEASPVSDEPEAGPSNDGSTSASASGSSGKQNGEAAQLDPVAARMQAKLSGKQESAPSRPQRTYAPRPKKSSLPKAPKPTGLDSYDPMNGTL